MAERVQSVCDADQGWVTKDRSGMIVIGLGNDELYASFKMTSECFERFYKELTEFRERELEGRSPS